MLEIKETYLLLKGFAIFKFMTFKLSNPFYYCNNNNKKKNEKDKKRQERRYIFDK